MDQDTAFAIRREEKEQNMLESVSWMIENLPMDSPKTKGWIVEIIILMESLFGRKTKRDFCDLLEKIQGLTNVQMKVYLERIKAYLENRISGSHEGSILSL